MKRAVLFDLGGTLVEYYGRSDIPAVVEAAIDEVQACLGERGLLHVPPEEVWRRVAEENHEASDYRVRPLEQRLARVFQLDGTECSAALLEAVCRRFMQPIFARARRYDDAIPTLARLRAEGYRVAIVSNTSWGSPAHLWREEIERHGLDEWVGATVFCRDVGWRKPAPQIYAYTLERLGTHPEECLFVGDDYRWDVAGPRKVGMEAVLINRSGIAWDVEENAISCLDELWARL